MKREISDYLEDILGECRYLMNRMAHLEYKDFIANEDLTKAFIRSLEVIGEAVKKIPDDIRVLHKDISWRDIAGMRDKLIHEYFGVDYEVVWQTVKEEIPVLKAAVKTIIKERKNI